MSRSAMVVFDPAQFSFECGCANDVFFLEQQNRITIDADSNSSKTQELNLLN